MVKHAEVINCASEGKAMGVTLDGTHSPWVLKPHSCLQPQRTRPVSSAHPGNQTHRLARSKVLPPRPPPCLPPCASVSLLATGLDVWTQAPVRVRKTLWRGGGHLVSLVLMGQHRADVSSGLPQGRPSPRGQGASPNGPGDPRAAVKQAVRPESTGLPSPFLR